MTKIESHYDPQYGDQQGFTTVILNASKPPIREKDYEGRDYDLRSKFENGETSVNVIEKKRKQVGVLVCIHINRTIRFQGDLKLLEKVRRVDFSAENKTINDDLTRICLSALDFKGFADLLDEIFRLGKLKGVFEAKSELRTFLLGPNFAGKS